MTLGRLAVRENCRERVERVERGPWREERGQVFQRKWHTVAEVAQMLGYGLTKTKMLVIPGSCGRSRTAVARILPEWVDEYVPPGCEAKRSLRPVVA